ncbi:hypothetical protein E2C01_008668 [Portunus trituberculatus]|uniref:Uncharacterized protein n=1 Tax=Portunus trituberculatus TaxID=210409 RepID=A0A5B7D4H7_PORTR|nr:hypothetical protein [Portunus trituberculatus]
MMDDNARDTRGGCANLVLKECKTTKIRKKLGNHRDKKLQDVTLQRDSTGMAQTEELGCFTSNKAESGSAGQQAEWIH